MNCCSNSSIWLSGLQKIMQQMTIVNKNIEKTFECSIYAVKLKSKYHAQRHIEIVHNNIKDFKCYSCAKKFSFKSHLQRHIKMLTKNQKL